MKYLHWAAYMVTDCTSQEIGLGPSRWSADLNDCNKGWIYRLHLRELARKQAADIYPKKLSHLQSDHIDLSQSKLTLKNISNDTYFQVTCSTCIKYFSLTKGLQTIFILMSTIILIINKASLRHVSSPWGHFATRATPFHTKKIPRRIKYL